MQYDVFISYSSKDSATAQAICHELEDNHIRCWMAPRDIPVGSKYASVITEAIKSSKAVVLVFSERSAMSPWVESEINIAFSNRKPIIPYKIDKAHVEDYSEFYLMLNNRHWIEAYPDFKTRFAELVSVVSNIINPHKDETADERKSERETSQNPDAESVGTIIPPPPPEFHLNKWLWIAIACMVVVLAVVLWPKGDDAPTPVTVVEQLDKSAGNVTAQDNASQPSRPATQQASQQQSQQQPVKEEPVASTTQFYVATTPSGVTVYVDGKRVGITPIDGKEIARGSHKVRLCKEGYQEKTITRTFGDRPVVINETLSVIPEPQTQTQSSPAVATASKINGHEYVDLGLSVKWATCNIGASSPSDYGDYYAWGETSTKNDYSWKTYKWCKGSADTMTKYCTNSKYGTVDSKTTLASNDDVAHVKWGGSWRMPTLAEIKELKSKCSWEWTTVNGVNGYKVTGPNGNSIFLPAAGYRHGSELYYRGSRGYYWSGSLYEFDSYGAYSLYFHSGGRGWYYDGRNLGRTVRPVTE